MVGLVLLYVGAMLLVNGIWILVRQYPFAS